MPRGYCVFEMRCRNRFLGEAGWNDPRWIEGDSGLGYYEGQKGLWHFVILAEAGLIDLCEGRWRSMPVPECGT